MTSTAFKGVAEGSLIIGEIDDKLANILQTIFSKIGNRPFYYEGYKEVETSHPVKVKGCHLVGNIAIVSISKDIKGGRAYGISDYDWVLAWLRG